ncbi:hypothetical protein [Kitasatospora sp. Ki12]
MTDLRANAARLEIGPAGDRYATALNNEDGPRHLDLRAIGNSIQLTASPTDCEGTADVWQVRLRDDDNGQKTARTVGDWGNTQQQEPADWRQPANVVLITSLPIAGCSLAVSIVVGLESTVPLLMVAAVATGTGSLAAHRFLKSQMHYEPVASGFCDRRARALCPASPRRYSSRTAAGLADGRGWEAAGMGSGVLAKLGGGIGGRTAALVAAGGLTAAGAGAGVWWAVHGPALHVVQRSAQVVVAGGGEQTAVAGCAKHETALSGGYAVDGDGFATTSEFLGGSDWLVSAYNPGGTSVTLTAYVLCVNASVEFAPRGEYTMQAHAFQDRSSDKIGGGDLTEQGPFAGLTAKSMAQPYCDGGGLVQLGVEFRATRLVTGRAVAPVPLAELDSASADTGSSAPSYWAAKTNPGTALSTRPFPLGDSDGAERMTRIVDPQPPEANYAVGVRPICAKLPSATIVTGAVDVPAGGTAAAAVACPKGRFVVGGGYSFREKAVGGAQRFHGDGWLYAPASGPTPGVSGHAVKDWQITGRNRQQAGAQYEDSVWIEHSDRETSTGNVYFDSHPHGADDQLLRGTTAPDSQHMVAAAVCATIDAEPTEPGAVHVATGLPQRPPAVDVPGGIASPAVVPTVPPSASPSTPPSTSPSQSGSPQSPSPSPSAVPSTASGRPSSHGPTGAPQTTPSDRPGSQSPTGAPPTAPSSPPTANPEPQPPAVTIEQPASGGTLRRGCEEHFSGTAHTRPGNQPITDPQATTWQLIGPNGPLTLGHGTTATFTVPLLADGTYPLVLTARDSANGLTGRTQTNVRITGCLR